MSDTILAISRASAHSKFLKDFYSFSTIFNSWKFQIIHDYSEQWGYDVAVLTTLKKESWVLIGVVDLDRLKLSLENQANIYHNSVLWYRSLSESEITDIISDASVVYDYDFFWDKLFPNFNLRDFQLQMYNSWSIIDMRLSIFPDYQEQLNGETWEVVPQDSVFYYSLTL